MTPKQFIDSLRSSVIDENNEVYNDVFTNTDPKKASDPYWRRALSLFNSLSAEQQEVFFEVLRQVSIDTTSNVLGILDGTSYLDGLEGQLDVTYNTEKLNGDLQDIFLTEEERGND